MVCDPGTDLGELLEAEVLAGLGHLLDNLSDPVAGQRQVRGSEKFGELVFADEAAVVHVWKRTEGSEVTRLTCTSQTVSGAWSLETLPETNRRNWRPARPLTDLGESFSELFLFLGRDGRGGGHVGNLELTE